MCKSLNAAVNKCINCCFLHLLFIKLMSYTPLRYVRKWRARSKKIEKTGQLSMWRPADQHRLRPVQCTWCWPSRPWTLTRTATSAPVWTRRQTLLSHWLQIVFVKRTTMLMRRFGIFILPYFAHTCRRTAELRTVYDAVAFGGYPVCLTGFFFVSVFFLVSLIVISFLLVYVSQASYLPHNRQFLDFVHVLLFQFHLKHS